MAFIQQEATGVYAGTLVEDMIDTVTREQKLYCDVFIPAYWNTEATPHPLTYVPLWAMSLPLKKGDKVLVYFRNGDLSLPVLWKEKYDTKVEEGFYKKYETTTNAGSKSDKLPTAENTVASVRLGTDSYLIKTDSYTVLHQNDGYVLIDKNGKVCVSGSEVVVSTKGNVTIDAGTGKISVSNSSKSLKETLDDIQAVISKIWNLLGTLTTAGSPAAQSASAWWSGVTSDVTSDLSKISMGISSFME